MKLLLYPFLLCSFCVFSTNHAIKINLFKKLQEKCDKLAKSLSPFSSKMPKDDAFDVAEEEMEGLQNILDKIKADPDFKKAQRKKKKGLFSQHCCSGHDCPDDCAKECRCGCQKLYKRVQQFVKYYAYKYEKTRKAICYGSILLIGYFVGAHRKKLAGIVKK